MDYDKEESKQNFQQENVDVWARNLNVNTIVRKALPS